MNLIKIKNHKKKIFPKMDKKVEDLNQSNKTASFNLEST